MVATLLVGLSAAGLVLAQAYYPKSNPQLSLSMLSQRAEGLSQITDPVKRDSLCIPLSAYGRALDRALPADARVFFADMLGPTNGAKLGYYYFLRNYLFPRDVKVSLGTNVVYHEGWFEGTPGDSPEELQTNGFDLMIKYGDKGFELVPLTPKGVPK